MVTEDKNATKEKIPFSQRSMFLSPLFYKTIIYVVVIDWVTKYLAHVFATKENETTKDMLGRFHFGSYSDGWIVGFRKVEHYRNDEYPDYWSVGYKEDPGFHDNWLSILEFITRQDLSPLWANTWILVPLLPIIITQLTSIFSNEKMSNLWILAGGLFLGAAIGNLGEGVVRGSVTDWIALWFEDLPLWFGKFYGIANFADFAVWSVYLIGLIGLLKYFFNTEEKKE